MKNKHMDYDELLRHPKWQKRRLKIMERDKWTCQVCGATDKPLNVHHKFYDRENKPWEYPDINLQTLCDDCHSKTHHVLDAFKKFTLEEKFDFFRRSVADVPCETREVDEFFILTHPRDPKYSFIVHVPSGLFSSFCVSVQEAYERMKAETELMAKVRKIIIDKMTSPYVFE